MIPARMLNSPRPERRRGRRIRWRAARFLAGAVVLGLTLLSASPLVADAAASAYSAAVSGTPGLVSYWRLGELSGTTAADAAGLNNGTYQGGYTLGTTGAIQGDPDTAVTLNGTSGYVSVPDSSSLAVGDTFTIEGWIKRGAVSTSENQVVASKQSGSWVLMLNSQNQLVLRRAMVGDVAASTKTVTDTSSWHYVAATKNGSSVHLYIDGQDVTGAVANQTMTDNTMPLVIGESSGMAFFAGTIDEVAVYRAALSGSTIAQHFQATAPTTSTTPTPTPTPTPTTTTSDPVIATAGDIACSPSDPDYNGGAGISSRCRQRDTASLLAGGANLAAVLPLGDTQYGDASLSDYQTSYGPTWGQAKSITRPAVGNHEYDTAGASGYFDYFDGVGATSGPAGPRGKGYYSFDIGAWHIIALNSECGDVGGCGTNSPQEKWLRSDLAAHPTKCTLAFWHRPLFNSSFTGSDTEMKQVWQDLYNAGADVVLNGHAHDYERFAPQTPAGALDTTRGIREFISGTGGEDHHSIPTPVANSQTHDDATFGVLKLTLHATSYDWRFVPVAGGTFTDSGSTACH